MAFALGAMFLPGLAKAQCSSYSSSDPNCVVTTVNEAFLQATRLTSGLMVAGPPEVAREIAIINAAMFDAANAASGNPYGSMAYTGGPVAGASVAAATLQAGITALQGVFGNAIWSSSTSTGGNTTVQTAVLTSIGNTYSAVVSTLPGGIITAADVALGTAAANANLQASGYTTTGTTAFNNAQLATDGSSAAILAGLATYTPVGSGTVPGVYVPPARPAMFPNWGGAVGPGTGVTPLGMTSAQLSAAEATVPGPPAVGSAAYAKALLQTECQGGSGGLSPGAVAACAAAGFAPRTAEQAKAALFWNDPGTTYQPPGHMLQITDTLAQSQNLSVLQASRLGALVGQAMDDAGIAAWGSKYVYNLWRPATAIQNCATDTAGGTVAWNAGFTSCDTSWTSLIGIPPHPDYLAGHPAFTGAAVTVLNNFLGDNIAFSSTSDAYCNGNGSAAVRGGSQNLIVGCTVPAGPSVFAYLGANTFYGTAASCTDAGGTFTNGAPFIAGDPATCLFGSTLYSYNPTITATGCNDVVNTTGLNAGINDSPLICPITETFTTASQASSGENGSTFSRVYGGIHTPFAVVDAENVGNLIGQIIASDANIPEPGAIGLLLMSLGLLAGARRYWPAQLRI
ncbi:MAG: hypothetical protein EXR07_08665 [Acetobacteraceae bacterium]|nr:hypothetical protein [Acetobacteraceae bacterium]